MIVPSSEERNTGGEKQVEEKEIRVHKNKWLMSDEWHVYERNEL